VLAIVCVKLRSKNAGWLLFLFGFIVVSRRFFCIYYFAISLEIYRVFVKISQLFADSLGIWELHLF